MELIPQFSDGNGNVCILNNRPNLLVPQASVCDGFVNTLEEVINLSSVECLSHPSYILYPNLKSPWKRASTLNICAEIFTPSNKINIMNCKMGAIMVTILILSTFSIYELNINSKQVVNDSDPSIILKNLKIENPNKIIICRLYINSIRNKFECLTYIIDTNIDILLISETKLNDTFPESKFVINGYHPPYRNDRTDKGGGLLLYVCEHIPSRLVNVAESPKIEAIVIEINLKKKKWLLIGTYNPHKSMIKTHLNSISMQFDEFHKKYDFFLIIEDFNSEFSE